MIAPDVDGNVITLPFEVEMLDVFTVAAEIVPVTLTLVAEIDPLLTIEFAVIVPSTVTFENTVCVIGAPLA
jgi:hypothetical protein